MKETTSHGARRPKTTAASLITVSCHRFVPYEQQEKKGEKIQGKKRYTHIVETDKNPTQPWKRRSSQLHSCSPEPARSGANVLAHHFSTQLFCNRGISVLISFFLFFLSIVEIKRVQKTNSRDSLELSEVALIRVPYEEHPGKKRQRTSIG